MTARTQMHALIHTNTHIHTAVPQGQGSGNASLPSLGGDFISQHAFLMWRGNYPWAVLRANRVCPLSFHCLPLFLPFSFFQMSFSPCDCHTLSPLIALSTSVTHLSNTFFYLSHNVTYYFFQICVCFFFPIWDMKHRLMMNEHELLKAFIISVPRVTLFIQHMLIVRLFLKYTLFFVSLNYREQLESGQNFVPCSMLQFLYFISKISNHKHRPRKWRYLTYLFVIELIKPIIV